MKLSGCPNGLPPKSWCFDRSKPRCQSIRWEGASAILGAREKNGLSCYYGLVAKESISKFQMTKDTREFPPKLSNSKVHRVHQIHQTREVHQLQKTLLLYHHIYYILLYHTDGCELLHHITRMVETRTKYWDVYHLSSGFV